MSDEKAHDVVDEKNLKYHLRETRRFLENIEDFYSDNHLFGVKFNIAHAVNELVQFWEDNGWELKEIACIQYAIKKESEENESG
jgi:hypothetical protein